MPQSKYHVELNSAGVRAMLKSAEMQSLLRERAKAISGSDSEVEVYVAGTRAVAEAHGDNKNNGLLKRMK